MIRRTLLIATATIAALITTACSDTAGPNSSGVSSLPAAVKVPTSASNDQGDEESSDRCGKEVSFTKWYTTSPAMTGFTCYGPGTYAGEILSRVPAGDLVLLRARYEVTDPKGRHSFKAVIEGSLNNLTGQAVLSGVVTEGWQLNKDVSVTFQRITPCAAAVGPSVPNVCFQGTIEIQKDKASED